MLPLSTVETVEFSGQSPVGSPEYSPSVLGITMPTVLSGAAVIGVIVLAVLLLNPRKGHAR